ncbi:MAG: VOC family protein [Gemmatimonadaceae bacterium]
MRVVTSGRVPKIFLRCLLCLAATACVSRTQSAIPLDTDRPAVVRGIDHFFATSAKPEPLYHFFRDTLQLPEVYPFRDYGDFASGVVSMGNVLFEVVTWAVPSGEKLPTELKGIAFEPSANVETTIDRLRAYGFHYQKPDSVTMTDSTGARRVVYVNTPLDGPGGLPPAMGSIFINDNLGSPAAVRRRKAGADELSSRNGGPLGVLSVREIVIGVEDKDVALAKWRGLLGQRPPTSGDVITWEIGPATRFVKAQPGAIIEMVVVVRSLELAREFLQSRGMASVEAGRLYTRPSAVEGLRIRLVE